MMVETRPVGFGLFGFGLFWLSLFFSPPSDCSSLPSTMTWAPCPHGVRTRGKKKVLRGSPAGLGPPSSREYCQCSLCSQGHAPSRHCQVNTSSKPVRCHATECDLPYFMPLATPKLGRRLPYENWSCRVGKRCRSLYSACLICPQHGSLRLGNQ